MVDIRPGPCQQHAEGIRYEVLVCKSYIYKPKYVDTYLMHNLQKYSFLLAWEWPKISLLTQEDRIFS